MAELSAPDLDLRYGRARLPNNLRALGAVGRYVPRPPAGSPHVIVKGYNATMSTAAHLQYLQVGKGRDGKDAALFGPQGVPVNPERFTRESEQDPHQFRFSVSLPDPQPFFPMRPYIEGLMRKVERDLSRPLDWLAAVHHDTDHTHAHIMLRGRDRDGKNLYLTNQYLTYGLRYRAIWVAQWMHGTGHERERVREQTMQREQGRVREPERQRAVGIER